VGDDGGVYFTGTSRGTIGNGTINRGGSDIVLIRWL